MNSLSWFLYWIDVAGSLEVVFGVASILMLAAVCALWVGCSFRLEDCRSDDKDKVRNIRAEWTWRFVIASSVLAILSCFTPSKNTMYAIAASQVGETIANNEAVKGIANDATKALQIWIKKQIQPDKKS